MAGWWWLAVEFVATQRVDVRVRDRGDATQRLLVGDDIGLGGVEVVDQSDRRARSQMTTRLVTEPVRRVGLADDVSPAGKRLLELLGAGHGKQFQMAAAVRGGSQLNDVELVGGFDPGCSVGGTALAPVKSEVTLAGVDPRDLRAGEIGQRPVASPGFGI